MSVICVPMWRGCLSYSGLDGDNYWKALLYGDYSVPVVKVDTDEVDNPPVGRDVGRGRSK